MDESSTSLAVDLSFSLRKSLLEILQGYQMPLQSTTIGIANHGALGPLKMFKHDSMIIPSTLW